MRLLTALAMLAAWLVVSNHCALAAFLAENDAGPFATSQQQCCPEADGSGSDPAPVTMVCCKDLRAASWESGMTDMKTSDSAVMFELRWSALDKLGAVHRASATLATGPPEARSFAEVVLQQSLLSHAPPASI